MRFADRPYLVDSLKNGRSFLEAARYPRLRFAERPYSRSHNFVVTRDERNGVEITVRRSLRNERGSRKKKGGFGSNNRLQHGVIVPDLQPGSGARRPT